MEAPIESPVSSLETPQQVATQPIQSLPAVPMENTDVFENMSAKKPMDMKSILLFGLLIGFSIYGILYYRKQIQQADTAPTEDDLTTMKDDIAELKFNLKKALGSKYQPSAVA